MSNQGKVKFSVGFVGCVLLTIPYLLLLGFIDHTFSLNWGDNITIPALILGFASGLSIQLALEKYVNN